jgi:hypothetical protein
VSATGDAFDLLDLRDGEDVGVAGILELADECDENGPLAVSMDAAAGAALGEGREEEGCAGGWFESLPLPSARTADLHVDYKY